MRNDIRRVVQAILLKSAEFECLRLMLRCHFVDALRIEVSGDASGDKLVSSIVKITDEYRTLDGVLEVAAAKSANVPDGVYLKLGPCAFVVVRGIASSRYDVEDPAVMATIAQHRPAIVVALDKALQFEVDAQSFTSVHALSTFAN